MACLKLSFEIDRGGDGQVSYKYMGPKKKPTGGHGGRGGDVIIRASRSVQNLNMSNYHLSGAPGEKGGANGWKGKMGKSREVLVPLGTVVTKVISESTRKFPDANFGKQMQYMNRTKPSIEFIEEDDQSDSSDDHSESSDDHSDSSDDEDDSSDDEGDYDSSDEDEIPAVKKEIFWADLDKHDKGLVVATGGPGGRGNGDLAALSFQFYEINHHHRRLKGKSGTTTELRLTLKSIADIGLVGFPNAGKSTLLGSISRAKPEVAPFPFTTLHPYIGTVEFTDGEQLTVADIPGLIEGAHENKGLGHRFLRHVERTSMLTYVIDCSLSMQSDVEITASTSEVISLVTEPVYREIIGKYHALVSELELYLEGLSCKPSILILNKMDVPSASEIDMEKLLKYIEEFNYSQISTIKLPAPRAVHQVSAKYGKGLADLVYDMRKISESTKM